mmetsp:Transcript_61002/g.150132  ORF Transcript_61002/g.150132 Transcript_61002/m.150132 type:complete len:132 (-) Transcript_61002:348-743(-)
MCATSSGSSCTHILCVCGCVCHGTSRAPTLNISLEYQVGYRRLEHFNDSHLDVTWTCTATSTLTTPPTKATASLWAATGASFCCSTAASGFLLRLNGVAVSWSSKKIKAISLSSFRVRVSGALRASAAARS